MQNPQLDIRIGTLVQVHHNDPVDYIRQILPYGFESFQLSFGAHIEGIDIPGLAHDLAEVLDQYDAVISSVGLYGNPLETDDAAEATRRSWQQLIEQVHLFGTDLVTGFTGRIRNRPIPDSIPRYKEVFTPLARFASERGVRLAFENCAKRGSWNRGDWNIAHNPSAWTLMFEALPMDHIGLEWEPCHQMLLLIDPMPQLRTWADRMFHIHGKCCNIRRDVIQQYGISSPEPFAYHRFPGLGDCNWTDIISDLRQAGYRGSIDIEGWHDPVYRDALEMTGQVHSLNYLKQCRGGTFIPTPSS